MKYLSLFSGIGGFELGIHQAYESYNKSKNERLQTKGNSTSIDSQYVQRAASCIGYSEIDKYAIQIYNKHFNHKNYGDITQLPWEELSNFDLLVGGFPCPSFSIAGKRKGLQDKRGELIFDIIKGLKIKQPKMFLLENVKGLLSHDKGNTMEIICEALCEVGYVIDFEVLNSKNFGVAQNRERVFIVG